ncbi:cobalamin-binding protein [Plasticicumulans acidivorans]|uniref:Iron complex transport system substrate-binding protein n=1 Tax=Plasticicumulans acidivorans TaxID=886464 RepID=A0A317MXS7_9GAMM|nr:cobalamin-binding protein [Plasticicumulans acidivorans]PWV64450.1 iron complex transport system substrate-binding protein [Plasticicumulans acidivorans]
MRALAIRHGRRLCALLAAVLGCGALAHADIVVTDDTGRRVQLAQPARRIVATAPHVTELLFAAGAGAQVIAGVSFSNWPPAAAQLPSVGSYTALDLEALLTLKPDLVVAWDSGNPAAQLAQIEALGIAVYRSEPRRLEQIPRDLERLGELAGTEATAQAAAQAFSARLAALRTANAGKSPVTVFYQVWAQPLITLNGEHLVSQVLALCGGVNIFAGLKPLAPTVSEEAVIAADPEAIIASGMAEERPEWLAAWRAWPQLRAVARDNLFVIPPDIIQRHGPRVLDGAQRACEILDTVRARRAG